MDAHGIRLSACPVCGGVPAAWRVRTTPQGQWPIERCPDCGYAFANPRPDMEYLSAFYTETGRTDIEDARPFATVDELWARERAFPNSSLDASRMVDTAKRLRRGSGGTSLDVGSGWGVTSHFAREAGFAPTLLEIDPSRLGVATALVGVAPVETLFEDFAGDDGAYDLIVMSQVLEHAADVDAWAGKAARLLAPGGVLVVAVPNFGSIFRRLMGVGDPFIVPPEHLNFFSPAALARLLERHGLTVTARQWVSRLSPDAARRRLGPLAPLAPALLGLIDRLRLGMYINVYALKP